MNYMKRSGYAFCSAAIALMVSAGFISFLLADNQPPYEYDVDKSYIKPNPALPGRQVTVHWALKVNRPCKGFIVRSIIDAKTRVIVSYDPIASLGRPPNEQYMERTFYLPENIESGTKIYRVNGEYSCNILQRFWPLKVQTPDLYFEIQ